MSAREWGIELGEPVGRRKLEQRLVLAKSEEPSVTVAYEIPIDQI